MIEDESPGSCASPARGDGYGVRLEGLWQVIGGESASQTIIVR